MIRPLEPLDHAAWLPLWNGYLTFYEHTLDDAKSARTFARLVDPEGDIFGFAAFDGDAMVGITHYLFHTTTWDDVPRCYLNDLFTLPTARGKGVARNLIEAVYDAARKQDAEQVYWTTQEFNSTARVLYDKVAAKTPFIKYAKVFDQ